MKWVMMSLYISVSCLKKFLSLLRCNFANSSVIRTIIPIFKPILNFIYLRSLHKNNQK